MVCTHTYQLIFGHDLRRYITLTCEHREAESVVGVAISLFWLLHMIVSFVMTICIVVHTVKHVTAINMSTAAAASCIITIKLPFPR